MRRAEFWGRDAEPGPLTTILCAVQHVLAMFVGIVTPPIVVAGALGLGSDATSLLIAMALFTSGVTTYMQVRGIGPFGSQLLSVQGTSFTFVPLAIQAGHSGGLPLVFGLTIALAPVEMVLSRFIGIARVILPPVVTGTVVTLIGCTLMKVALTDFAGGHGARDFGSPSNLALGSLVTVTILVLNRFGPGFFKTSSIAIGLATGYAVAWIVGRVDFEPATTASWLAAPMPLETGIDFDAVYLLPWVIGYVVTTIESIGDLTATSQVSHEPVDGPIFVRRLQRGVLGDGLGSLFAGVFGAMPNTTFSQNNGVIALTGVAARRVGYVVALLLVLLGVFPKFGAVVGAVPKPVLGGATLIMFAMVALAGIRIASSAGFGSRSTAIFGAGLVAGLAVTMVPDWCGNPDGSGVMDSIRIILQSGLAVGAIVAMTLNLLLPAATGE